MQCSDLHFSIAVTGGQDGAVAPAGINTNEIVYAVRHAEAHPRSWWEEEIMLPPGSGARWTSPMRCTDKINPDQVYSIDPAQVIPSKDTAAGNTAWSYVRPSLTAEPYTRTSSPLRLALQPGRQLRHDRSKSAAAGHCRQRLLL